MSKKILIIGDSHADSSSTFKAADQIGQAIVKERPDVVVHMGDIGNLDSVSTHEELDERSYKDDIKAIRSYQKRLWAPAKKAKRKLPDRILCLGNHDEWRVERYLRSHPELKGFLNWRRDTKVDKYWSTIVPYDGEKPGVIEIEGILFAHYLVSGVLGKPVGGLHQANMLLNKMHQSCVVGHSHTFDFKTHSRPDGTKMHALVAGCSFNLTHDWCGMQVNKIYNRGYAVLDNVKGGDFDLSWRSLR